MNDSVNEKVESKHLNKFMKVERCYGASIAVSKLVFHVSDF